jgi:hypothetical protein
MSDNELRELVASLAIAQKKTDEQLQRTDLKLNKIAKMVGSISNNQGDIAEEFFYNSLASTPKLNGIKYDFIYKNLSKQIKNLRDEYDIVLVNGKDIAIVETKYKAHTRDIEKLIGKKYENFKKLFPEYKDYSHHLGIASFYINDDVMSLALDNGVMVLQRKGDLIETILP